MYTIIYRYYLNSIYLYAYRFFFFFLDCVAYVTQHATVFDLEDIQGLKKREVVTLKFARLSCFIKKTQRIIVNFYVDLYVTILVIFVF